MSIVPITSDSPETARVEIQAIERCDAKMQELRLHHEAWLDLFDNTMPDNAPRAEVVALMSSAPSDFSLGLMYGKFTVRLEIEAITGRPFE